MAASERPRRDFSPDASLGGCALPILEKTRFEVRTYEGVRVISRAIRYVPYTRSLDGSPVVQ